MIAEKTFLLILHEFYNDEKYNYLCLSSAKKLNVVSDEKLQEKCLYNAVLTLDNNKHIVVSATKVVEFFEHPEAINEKFKVIFDVAKAWLSLFDTKNILAIVLMALDNALETEIEFFNVLMKMVIDLIKIHKKGCCFLQCLECKRKLNRYSEVSFNVDKLGFECAFCNHASNVYAFNESMFMFEMLSCANLDDLENIVVEHKVKNNMLCLLNEIFLSKGIVVKSLSNYIESKK